MKKHIVWRSLLVVAFALFVSKSVSMAADCPEYIGGNAEGQNYTRYANTDKSYLTALSNGSLMRFQAEILNSGYLVEFYDAKYNLTSRTIIPVELPLFGGFYDDGTYFYIVSGQTNTEEDKNTEVYRITKYSHAWVRLGSCGLYGANTTVPFDAGSCRMSHYGTTLNVLTCHKMYRSADGLNHQANVYIEINTSNMTITDSRYIVSYIYYGYVSHSFNQYVINDSGNVISVNHGDAYPRSVVLYSYSKKTDVDVHNIPGETGDNDTGVSVGGLVSTASDYLVAYNAVNAGDSYSAIRNIYVGVVSKDLGTVSEKKITSYSSGESPSTPQLVKIDSQNALLMWDYNNKVTYCMLNASGVPGTQYTMDGVLSDCKPIVTNGKVIWYTYTNGQTDFYEISTGNIASHNHITTYSGHKFDTIVPADTYVSLKCSKCGKAIPFYESSDYSLMWAKEGDGTYSSLFSHEVTAGQKIECWPSPGLSIISGDTSVAVANGTTVRFLKKGMADLYIYKSGEASGVITHFYVDIKPISGCSISMTTTYKYTGQPIIPNIKITDGTKTLTAGVDYKVTYSDNVACGRNTAKAVIEGMGSYIGSITKYFSVEKKQIADCSITMANSFTYTGCPITPGITVTDEAKTLVEGVDYKVTYSNNIEYSRSGAKAVIEGMGEYGGSIAKYFTIEKGKNTITLSKSKYELNRSDDERRLTIVASCLAGRLSYSLTSYSISMNCGSGTLSVDDKGVLTIPATMYGSITLAVSSSATGSYLSDKQQITITISSKYADEAVEEKTKSTETEKKPTKTSVSKLTKKSKTKIYVKWKKNTTGTGYEIQTASDKSFKKNKKTTKITSNKKTSTTISIKKMKKCYVRIRTYKKVKGKGTVYSGWSTVKYKKMY